MLTGQECIADDDSRITASTIEMADFSEEYDIAVIDEAQLTADPDRGHCWTKAILGLKAHEIHVCMSPAAESAVTHLIHLCGDSLAICRYQRKTALICEDTPFSFPEVFFRRCTRRIFQKSVLDVAGRLEEEGIKASVIYGSLPPEIRRRQMQLLPAVKPRWSSPPTRSAWDSTCLSGVSYLSRPRNLIWYHPARSDRTGGQADRRARRTLRTL